MNGHIHAPLPGEPAPSLISDDPDTALLRIYAALAASCFLHAAMLFLPYLGESIHQPRAGGEAVKSVLSGLHVTLKTLNTAVPATFSVAPTKAPAPVESPIALALADHMEMGIAELQSAQSRSEGADLLPIPAPVYYTTDQLTKRPQPTVSTELDPPELMPIVASGTIILKLWISDLGEVSEVEIEESAMPEAFTRQAVAAFKHLRFLPGERNGVRVGTVMRIEVNYLDGRVLPP